MILTFIPTVLNRYTLWLTFLEIFDYMSYFDNSGILIIGKGCDEDFTTAVMSGINAFSEGFNGSKFSTDIRYWGTYSGQIPVQLR